jgi:ATP-binding cassette subfamily B protein
LILRLYDPVEGQVQIDGRDIRLYTLESLRAQMSVVLQDSLLFAASVADNISYGAPGATPDQIEAAARLANAHEFIQALPNGYETQLGERGVNLSHGQRQRIAIARAALRQAPILILDEPTTGLDEENEQMVIESLYRLARGLLRSTQRAVVSMPTPVQQPKPNLLGRLLPRLRLRQQMQPVVSEDTPTLPSPVRGCTTFLITHNLQLAARAGLILFLENGRILERGTHEELMQANGRYAALWRLQTSTPADRRAVETHSFAG